MSPAHQIELVIGLLVAVTVLTAAAKRLAVPYPIVLFVGGAALGLVLGWLPNVPWLGVKDVPRIALKPEVVFLLFLPPLLYAEAWQTDWAEFKANRRPILLLACGLVLATTAAVAAVAHAVIPGMGWGPSFVLGAVLAPTDTVAPAAILRRMRVPRRVEVVLNGESLINDATALVAYKAAIAAVAAGTFSLAHAGWDFVRALVVGAGTGLGLGVAGAWLHRRQRDYCTEIALSLLIPFAAYLAAEQMHASGVVAVVAAGMYIGRRAPRILTAEVRVRAVSFWDALTFLLNGLLFALVGLQLPDVFRGVAGRPALALVGYGVVICLTLILVRAAWVFPATYLPRLLIPAIRRNDPYPNWRPVVLVAWTGLRGGISVAAALALPVINDRPFPHHDLILFLTFCALLATLVGQGLGMGPLIRRLGLQPGHAHERHEAEARVHAARAALGRLEELAKKHAAPQGVTDRMRSRFEWEADLFARGPDGHAAGGLEERADAYRRLRQALLRVQREAVIGLRDGGRISDDVLHKIERDLDLEELRLEPESM